MAVSSGSNKSHGALVLYMPALHAGYINFIKKHDKKDIYLLNHDILRAVPALERDIRAVEPLDMVKVVQVFVKKPRRVQLLDKESLNSLPQALHIVMPDEDISHVVHEDYLSRYSVTFDPVFLRWDKQITQKESIVPPDRVLSSTVFDKKIMTHARELSAKSPDWWRQVGACIIKNESQLFGAYNEQMPSKDYGLNTFGDPKSNFGPGEATELTKPIHAEASLIAQAAKKGIVLEGSSIYVTTFPCPACARLIVMSGITKVYYQDGYSLMDAEDILTAAQVEIVQVVRS